MILFSIFTCNRFFYMKNCLESIIECVDLDRVKLLICDNNTVEKEFDPYINEMASKYNIEVQKFTDRTRNELYRAMNWAIKYGLNNKFKIINFIQDDYQYMYRRDDHLEEIERIFKKQSEIVQIHTNMVWKRKRKGQGKIKIFKRNNTRYAIFLEKRAVDNGFTRLEVYQKTGLYPTNVVSWGGNTKVGFGKRPGRYKGVENGEVWFGRCCAQMHMNRINSLCPNLGMMYDCAYVRGDVRGGRYFPPPGRFYMKMLDQKQIDQIIRNNKKKKFTYIEDLCIADGWEAMTTDKHSPLKEYQSIK